MELGYEEHIGVFHADKEGKATACAKAEVGHSMLYSKIYKQCDNAGVKMQLGTVRS